MASAASTTAFALKTASNPLLGSSLSSSSSVSCTKSFVPSSIAFKKVANKGIRSSIGDASSECVRRFVISAFEEKRAFKVISGLNNFDASNVASVISAAEKGGATHVDIACDPELVRLARSLTTLPICVSSVEPEKFVAAVEAGAHMVEIGNFDSFYESGRTFSEEEVLDLAAQTRQLLPNIILSVTIPHTLPLDSQVSLAEKLENLGADIIQTEGGTSSSPQQPGVHGLMQKAAPTLAAAYSISHAVSIPVMCASGLSDVTVPMALACGASGVGIGSAVNKLNNDVAMVAAVRSISDAIDSCVNKNVESVKNVKA